MQKIVTHSGSFDPDDVLAAATVSIYLGKDNFEIIRSRDEEVINKADWVVDVGGEYDPVKRRFDHHQNGVPERDNGVPYSSFGLVWREIGADVCGSRTIADEIERKLVQPIDAADNRVTVCNIGSLGINSFEFFDVVNAHKPVWGSDEDFDTGFKRAVSFARKLLKRLIAHGQGQEAMRQFIKSVYDATENKELLTFDKSVSRDILSEYEGVRVFVSPVLGVNVEKWMAGVVPQRNGGFQNRALFAENWAGLSDEELAEASGIPGAVFCHKERYIFVAKTKEAALRAASEAIYN